MEFNEKLQQLRKERGYSQEQLAELTEVSRQAVSKWETGETQPEMAKLLLLGKVFGVSLDELCGGDPPQPKETVQAKKPEKIWWFAVPLCLLAIAAMCFFGWRALNIWENKANLEAQNSDTVFAGLEIKDFHETIDSADDNGMTVTVVITPSVSTEDMTMTVTCVDSYGSTTTTEAVSASGGIYTATLHFAVYTEYFVSASVTDGRNTYTCPLARYNVADSYGFTSDVLWDK